MKKYFSFIIGFSISTISFSANCPDLEGFFIQELRKQAHFEFYNLEKGEKIVGYHYRTFDADGKATKREFKADDQVYPIDKLTTTQSKCRNDELIRTVVKRTEKTDIFPGNTLTE